LRSSSRQKEKMKRGIANLILVKQGKPEEVVSICLRRGLRLAGGARERENRGVGEKTGKGSNDGGRHS